jgi:Zn-dependent protease
MNWEGAILNVALLWMLTAPHEFAHAWTALKLGDDTPLREGRVTLNPLAHVDWLGTLLLPLLTSLLTGGFLGWGKPVNSIPSRLRWGLSGLALVALAGPASNIIFAVVLAVVAAALPALAPLAVQAAWLSIYLAIFNMLPVPPLDGSKLLLAARVPWRVYEELARFGFLLILVVMKYSDLGGWMSMWSDRATAHLLRIFV